MEYSRLRRALIGALMVVMLGVAPAAAPAAAASFASVHTAATTLPAAISSSRPLNIRSTATELIAPATAAPGPTTFRVSTAAEGSGWIGLARLRPGVTWESFLQKLRDTVSDSPARVVSGSAALAAAATLLGGVVVHPGRPGAFTEELHPGLYVLFDYLDVTAAPQPRHRTLRVTERGSGTTSKASATLSATDVQGVGPRFGLRGPIRTGAPVGFANTMTGTQVAEAVFFPIAADVTDARLAAYFAAFRDGSADFPPDPPFDLATGTGSLPLSAGHELVLRLVLAPGRYVVVDFLKDADDGIRLAKKGQYRIVEAS